jgi:hypothetical protein
MALTMNRAAGVEILIEVDTICVFFRNYYCYYYYYYYYYQNR